MKKWISLLLVLLLLVTGCAQFNKSNEPSESDKTATVFDDFLSGKIAALGKDGSEILVDQYIYEDLQNAITRYAIYDMNGDEIPELIIQSPRELAIFWLKDSAVVLWHTNVNYFRPLNNGAILYTRNGAAPPHVDYIYIVLDYEGNVSSELRFMECEAFEANGVTYPAVYQVNGEEVTKEAYDSATSEIKAISDNQISWKTLQTNHA